MNNLKNDSKQKNFKLQLFLIILFFLLGCILSLFWNTQDVDSQTRSLILSLRVPRILTAISVGAALSVAGCLLQSLFRNPLTEPFTLGLSSGAALAAVLCASLGYTSSYLFVQFGWALPSIAGALLVSLFLLVLGSFRGVRQETYLLIGVAIHFLCASGVALISAVDPQLGVQTALMWLLGDLTRSNTLSSSIFLAITIFFTIKMYLYQRSLDLLLLGEVPAKNLGLNYDSVRIWLLIPISLLTAGSVALSGIVGFVGLLAPHFSRSLWGSLHSQSLIGSAVIGSCLVVWADLLSRFFFFPLEVPVGVITALIGSPFLIVLLLKNRRSTQPNRKVKPNSFFSPSAGNANKEATSLISIESDRKSLDSTSDIKRIAKQHSLKINDFLIKTSHSNIISLKNLTVLSGQAVGVFGPNGSGKSTLFRGLGRLLEPDFEITTKSAHILNSSNKVLLDLQNSSRENISRNFSYVYLEAKPEFDLTVFEYIEQGRFLNQVPDESMLSAIDSFSLRPLLSRDVKSLSQGQWALTLLCRAFVQDPKILVIDELLSPLDLNFQIEIGHLLQNWVKQNSNRFLFIVSHDLSLLFHLCENLMTLKSGHILTYGPLKLTMNELLLQKLFNQTSVDLEESSQAFLEKDITHKLSHDFKAFLLAAQVRANDESRHPLK